jgi:hypothetical protein
MKVVHQTQQASTGDPLHAENKKLRDQINHIKLTKQLADLKNPPAKKVTVKKKVATPGAAQPKLASEPILGKQAAKQVQAGRSNIQRPKVQKVVQKVKKKTNATV